jgi:hypothetical protein
MANEQREGFTEDEQQAREGTARKRRVSAHGAVSYSHLSWREGRKRSEASIRENSITEKLDLLQPEATELRDPRVSPKPNHACKLQSPIQRHRCAR